MKLLNEFTKATEGLWNGLKIEFGKVYSNPNLNAFSPMHEAELPSGIKLRVFDFDDTLVKTTSFIYVKHKDGKESKLTPGEYAIYEPKSGDQFDFSDFQKVNQPQEIKGITKLLKTIVRSEGERKVVILTARAAYQPIKDYLSDIGLNGIYVVALADSDPQKKADWIEDKIKKGYNDVFFIDDSHKNVAAVGGLKKKYPDIKIKVQQVRHDVPKAPKEKYDHTKKAVKENKTIMLSDIVKEILITESGIRNIKKLAKENNKADLYFHMDLDGVTSAIGMKAYLERYGIKVVNAEHIQYGGREYSAPKPTPGHMVVLVDFAHGKPGVTIHTDHHEAQSGVEAGTASNFKKKPSNVETISQEISPSDIFPSTDIKIISTVDSADFASQGITVDQVIATAFKMDKSIDITKNRRAMGFVANKVILAFKNQPRFLENIVMQASPSLISIYNVAMKNAKAAGLKPEDLDIPQAFYMRDQRPEKKQKELGSPAEISGLGNGEYGMVGNVVVQYGLGNLKGGGHDRYILFKMNPDAEYMILGYPMGLVQAAKNPFKKGTNPFNLGDIAKDILNKNKSYLDSKVLTFRDIKKMMESDIQRAGSDRSFGFTMKDLIALFGSAAKGVPTGKKKEVIDAIANKHYHNLTQEEKEQLEGITVTAYDLITKQSGGHRDITNISGINFLGKDAVSFTKRIMQDLASELKTAKLKT